MPRQKLTRKPPRREGKLGHTQKRGSQDPEHQQGRGRKDDTTELRHSRQPNDELESEQPRTVRKQRLL